VQIAENLSLHGPPTFFPHLDINISGKNTMKCVMQILVFGKV
jgi:hypothetical protein